MANHKHVVAGARLARRVPPSGGGGRPLDIYVEWCRCGVHRRVTVMATASSLFGRLCEPSVSYGHWRSGAGRGRGRK